MIEQGNITDKVNSHPETRGWFYGGYMPEGDFFHSKNVELKYAQYKKGEKYIGSTTDAPRKTLAILISGKVRFSFPSTGKTLLLQKPFDYIADDEIPGDHELEILEDSIILAVRQHEK